MEELKAMFRVCVHIKKDGIRCNSPALKGGNFCFQHIGGSIRELTRARSIYNGPQLDFLYPGTRQAIQHNLFVVAQAMNDGKLELATANTYDRLFSTCERNLRRWEMQQKKSGPEPELLEVPEDSPDACIAEDPIAKNDVAPTEVSEANEPTLSPFNDSDSGPLKHSLRGEQNPSVSSVSSVVNPPPDESPLNSSLSEEHKRTVSKAASIEPDREPDNLGPKPSPETEPLVLTPEEREIFNELETRYINDPSLADRIMDTYCQIRERRRAAEEH